MLYSSSDDISAEICAGQKWKASRSLDVQYESRLCYKLMWLWSVTTPLFCRNPKLTYLAGRLVQRKQIWSPNQVTVAPGHLETQKRTCTPASHFNETSLTSHMLLNNYLGVYSPSCYSMCEQPSINRTNRLNRTPLLGTTDIKCS